MVLTDDELRMISFSTGKRGCPAVVLGSTITTIMLARMLQGFTWEPICKEVPINLDENHDDLSLAKPLVLIAKPRLPQHLYPKILKNINETWVFRLDYIFIYGHQLDEFQGKFAFFIKIIILGNRDVTLCKGC